MTAAVAGPGKTGGAPAAPCAIRRSGYGLLNDPLLNKGVAFTEAERDAFDQAHDHENLFVAGWGLFPTSGAVNPTFTLTALALYSAEYIVRNWSSLA